jgi:hypothetical protein
VSGGTGKLKAYFTSSVLHRPEKYHRRFHLLVGGLVQQSNFVANTEDGRNGNQPAVRAYHHRLGLFLKRLLVLARSLYADGNAQEQPMAAAFLVVRK